MRYTEKDIVVGTRFKNINIYEITEIDGDRLTVTRVDTSENGFHGTLSSLVKHQFELIFSPQNTLEYEIF